MTRTSVRPGMGRRSFLRIGGRGAAVVAAGSAVTWLSGCGSGETAASPSRLSVKLAWIPNVEYAGVFVGVNDGFYTKQGLTVDVLPGGPNSAVVPMVTTNRVNVGVEAIPENVATAVARGSKLKIVGAGLQKSPECWISLADNPVKSPKEIEGKKLGITLAGKNTALVFMKRNGVDVSKVTLVPIQFDPAPLAAREVDAIWGFASNQPVSLALRGVETHVMPLADYGFNRMQSVFFVSQQTLDDPAARENARKFMAGSRQGWEAALRDHKHGADVIIKKYGADLGLKLDEQIKSLDAIAPYVTGDDAAGGKGLFWMSDALIQETITSLSSIGIKLDASLFTNELLG
ncbi:myristoyl transferase [Sphaerisporangium siamense]|uniref:ABC-type nitrate/sulfonate/bicarbonate transport system substrate-binding protein n=1 Tax=Sphaerisporangium siamense TaxID=795645 RepID=A0A7W7D3L3_9ACTN|nr:ABC transporter substrate-binding protein [Sphaerisporangium siamense]MBB4699598.1 ABC-type nitrate/sulfonate/bicarbonate transport system substrate-binding protein [Sphaerisporangium siamense]GII87012.1 myristoyl transferase [Sphaerisporangium siamense]